MNSLKLLIRPIYLVMGLNLALFTGAYSGNLGLALEKARQEATQNCNSNLTLSKIIGSPINSIEDLPEIKMMTLNTLNLYLPVGKFELDNNDNYVRKPEKDRRGKAKPASQRRGLERVIRQAAPDILALQEVEGEVSAENFEDHHLSDNYEVFLSEGNDSRGIRVATFVRKKLLNIFDVEVVSHIDATWVDPKRPELGEQKVFSRDVIELRFYLKTPSGPKLAFVNLNTHLKSKRDRHLDPQSRRLRGAQVRETVSIIQNLQQSFGKKLPIIEMGDHNAAFNYEPEFLPLFRNAGFTDSLNFAQQPLSKLQRVSHTYHPNNEPAKLNQIDGILVPKHLTNAIKDAMVLPYYDDNGRLMPLAKNYKMRQKQPSDHKGILTIFDTKTLLGLENYN